MQIRENRTTPWNMNPRSARAQKKGYIVIFVVIDSDVDIAALGGRPLVGIGCRNGHKWVMTRERQRAAETMEGRHFFMAGSLIWPLIVT